MSRDFRRYAVFEKSHQLALDLYRVSGRFPDEERFGLTAPVRRAAMSIPTNLAEGAGRTTDVDFARFVEIAMGSASEVEYQLLLARDLGYLDARGYEPLCANVVEVKKMLYA